MAIVLEFNYCQELQVTTERNYRHLNNQFRFKFYRRLSPRVTFQCSLFYGIRTLPCAIACINIFTHVKDPVVHVRVR